jgi:serine protease
MKTSSRVTELVAGVMTAIGAIAFVSVRAGAQEVAPVAEQLLADGVHRADVLAVTLRNGLLVRVKDGQLVNLPLAGAVAGVVWVPGNVAAFEGFLREVRDAGGVWERGFPDVSDEVLEQMHATAERALGKEVQDQTLQFTLRLRVTGAVGELRSDAVATRLEALGGIVVRAEPFQRMIEPPAAPDYTGMQGYAMATPGGIGARAVNAWPGGTGAGVRVVDCEYNVNMTHVDLPAISRAGPVSTTTAWADHGTAVFGQLVSRPDTSGTTGMVHGVTPSIAHLHTGGFYNVAGSVTSAVAALASGPRGGAGGVILIEAQMSGPDGNYAPVEWSRATYNAIVTAVGNGVVVVEAGANGSANLDSTIFQTGNGGHYPFLPQNDSGAILVGAGNSVTRERLSFSSYGQTVDLQGWGGAITTCGYGSLYGAEGVNAHYTATFGGTSGASPIVTAAVVQVQAVHHAVRGSYLTPAVVKNLLRATGTPQGSATATQSIGPLPSVPAALISLLGGDCNSNGRPDEVDILIDSALDLNLNRRIDSCEPCVADLDDGTGTGVPGSGVGIEDLLYYLTRFESGEIRADVDDGSLTGRPDGGVGVEDLLYFLTRYEAGC